MQDFPLMSLLLIPFALGEAFLIWALWRLIKQGRRSGATDPTGRR